MQDAPKILVIRGGAIGDFVLTLPVLAALRLHFPAAGLEILGYPRIAGLALAGGLVDAVRSIESRSLATFFAERATLDGDWADYFSDLALIVSYLYDPDETFQRNLRRVSPAQFIQGAHRPDERGQLHATEIFLRALERLAIFSPDPVPRLKISPAGKRAVEAGEGAERVWMALHPGSGSEKKNWPEARWRQVLERLMRESELNFLLVGGEAEGSRLVDLSRGLPPGRFRLAQSLPLPELAAELQGCARFVGHDSGITHLAAALGLSGVALWGASNERIWRPLGDAFVLLRHSDGIENLTVEMVFEALQAPGKILAKPAGE